MHHNVTARWRAHDVYIGRPGKWGNPIPLVNPSDEQERRDCLRRYINYLDTHRELVRDARNELRGQVLGCYCAPRLCHGDVLARIAEGMTRQEIERELGL